MSSQTPCRAAISGADGEARPGRRTPTAAGAAECDRDEQHARPPGSSARRTGWRATAAPTGRWPRLRRLVLEDPQVVGHRPKPGRCHQQRDAAWRGRPGTVSTRSDPQSAEEQVGPGDGDPEQHGPVQVRPHRDQDGQQPDPARRGAVLGYGAAAGAARTAPARRTGAARPRETPAHRARPAARRRLWPDPRRLPAGHRPRAGTAPPRSPRSGRWAGRPPLPRARRPSPAEPGPVRWASRRVGAAAKGMPSGTPSAAMCWPIATTQ